MGGAAPLVDVPAVGRVEEGHDLGPRPLEDLGAHPVGGPVGQVQAHLQAREVRGVFQEEVHVHALGLAEVPHGADAPGRVGLLQKRLYGLLGLVGELLPRGAEELDAVVPVGVVAGGDHGPGGGPQAAGEVGHPRGGQDPQVLHPYPLAHEARRQRGLQKVRGLPGVLGQEDHGPRAFLAEVGPRRLA